MAHYLILKKLTVRHANAISGQYIHGFPGLTAFTGFMWALERKWNEHNPHRPYVRFARIGVIAHDYREHAIDSDKGPNFQWKKAPPIVENKAEGATKNASFSIAGYLDMTISLVIEVERSDTSLPDSSIFGDDDIDLLSRIVERMRIAGGKIDKIDRKTARPVYRNGQESLLKGLASLGYGNVLIARPDLLDLRRKQLVDAWKIISDANPGMSVTCRVTEKRADLLPEDICAEFKSDAPSGRQILPENSMFSASPSDIDVMLSLFFFIGDEGSANTGDVGKRIKDDVPEIKATLDGQNMTKAALEATAQDKAYQAILSEIPYLPPAAREILKTRPKGWFVPVVVGYVSINPELPPEVAGARDGITNVVPSEAAVSLCEWVSIRRALAGTIDEMMWEPKTTYNEYGEKIAFSCENNKRPLPLEVEMCDD